MKQFGAAMEARYKNIILDGFDPVAAAGFTQVPNVILKSTDLSVGAKLTYALLLSYAWQKESCFPGQETLASRHGRFQTQCCALSSKNLIAAAS